MSKSKRHGSAMASARTSEDWGVEELFLIVRDPLVYFDDLPGPIPGSGFDVNVIWLLGVVH
jgi:hypothetical protein